MELKDTVNLMLSDNYKLRAQAELLQLEIRIEKLKTFLKKYAKGELSFKPNCSIELLTGQLSAMECYKSFLDVRANIEDIGNVHKTAS